MIAKRLRGLADLAYLYGSAISSPGIDSDIDILLIVPDAKMPGLWKEVASLIRDTRLKIHPTVVTPEQFRENEMFQQIANSGESLW